MRRRKVDTRKCARDDANQHSNTIKCKCTRSTWKCVCVCVFEIEPKLKSAIWSTKTFTPGHQIDHWMKHLNNCVIINCIHDPLSPTITINIHSKGFQHCHQHSFRLPFFFLLWPRVSITNTLSALWWRQIFMAHMQTNWKHFGVLSLKITSDKCQVAIKLETTSSMHENDEKSKKQLFLHSHG